MTTIYYDRVIIIQSLASGKTGKLLFDDLNLLTMYTGDLVKAEINDVNSTNEFFDILTTIATETQISHSLPLIHLEAHGTENGLELSSGEQIPWEEIKPYFISINDASRMNLMISVSACHGGRLTEVVLPTDRAPCRAIIAPKSEMSSDELLRDFTAYYEEMFKTRNSDKAVARLNRGLTGNAAPYVFIIAETYFQVGWSRYIKEQCTDAALNRRANNIIRQLRQKKTEPLPSRNEIKQAMISNQPRDFENTAAYFFMYDKYPEIKKRISVSYEEMMESIRAARGCL